MLVSVIMPTYNCSKYIEDSIKSVLDQTINDWELHIIDDCSTDNTFDIVYPYLLKYSNIHYYTLTHNSGAAVARSEGIRFAQGKYIAFLDSDDLWNPNKLEKQIQFMEEKGAMFCATGYKSMDESGNSLHIAYIPPKKTDYKKMIRLSNPIGNLTAIYNQEALGKFEVPNIRKRNDFALWLQLLKRTEYCYGIQEVLASYRTGRIGSISKNKLSQIKYHWMLYRSIERRTLVACFYDILCWIIVKSTGIGLKRIVIED